MKLIDLLITTALVVLAGCASTPMTPEQKALSKAYDAISSGKTAAGSPK